MFLCNMENFFNPLHTDWLTWSITLLCAFISGLSKSGLKGFAMINIPILAHLYGGMASVGILLPFLVFGDLFALFNYRKGVQWEYIKKLIPWAFGGILLATVLGKYISDTQFRYTIAISILICLALLIYKDLKNLDTQFTRQRWFATTLGLSGGFATMIGNAAGPIFNLYLMSMRLPKETFIGTGAIFYLILNTTKIPLHAFYWHSITWQSLQLNFILLPVLLLGAFIGKYIVKLIPEKIYRRFVIVVIGISAVLLFFK